MAALALTAGRTVDWRKAGLVAVSAVINGGLILILSMTALGPQTAPRPDYPVILVEIEPRPLLQDERPREPVTAADHTEAIQSRSPTDAAPAARRPDPAYEGRSAPIQPRIAVQPPAGSPPAQDVWRVDPTDRRGAMARSLRQGAIGCTSPERLSEAERLHCRERFGARASVGPDITGSGDPERDAAFARQGARRLAEWEAQRRPLSGGVGVVGPADCVGSNFGTGCAGAHLNGPSGVDMRQGADSLVRQKGNKGD